MSLRPKSRGIDTREKAMERAKGIEPSYAAWEAAVLPLNYARLDAYQADLAETAPSAKRLGGLSRRNLNFSFAFFKVWPFMTVL
jgi:hypothetical protein